MITLTWTRIVYDIEDKPHWVGRIDGANNYKQAMYAVGEVAPNYPMPTLIAETFIVSDTVAIYHSNRDRKVIEMIWWKD